MGEVWGSTCTKSSRELRRGGGMMVGVGEGEGREERGEVEGVSRGVGRREERRGGVEEEGEAEW